MELLAYFYNIKTKTYFVDIHHNHKGDTNIEKIGLCFEIHFTELLRRLRKRKPDFAEGIYYIHVEFDVPDLPF